MSDKIFVVLISLIAIVAGIAFMLVFKRNKVAKFSFFALTALGLYLLISAFSIHFPEHGKNSLHWNHNLDAAFKEAAKTKKPILVDCWAPWCKACLELADKTFINESIKPILKKMILVKLNMDEKKNQKIWEKYKIAGLPWVGFFTPSGELMKGATLNNYEPAEQFTKRLNKVFNGKLLKNSKQKNLLTQKMAKYGLFLTLLLVFLAGVGVSLTPCVYPLIPITITIIGAKESKNIVQKLFLSLTFVAGLAVTYTTLGVFAGLTGKGLGTWMQSPMVTGFIAFLFVIMGLSYVDLFTIQLPSGLQAKLSLKNKGGFLGAILLGLVSGLIAAPCAGPVTIAIIGFIAGTGSPWLGFLFMLFFSLGLGLLFVIIGTATQLINKIPKTGQWMEVIKYTFALILIAFGLYYLNIAFPTLGKTIITLGSINPF